MTEAVLHTTVADAETVEILRDSAADFCQRRLEINRLRELRGTAGGYDRAAWREMCELGWSGILAPEASGGMALGMVAMGTICRQLGSVAAPEPMLESGAVTVALLGALADPGALLEGLVSGDITLTTALAEDCEFPGAAPTPPTLSAAPDGPLLEGTSHAVALGNAVDCIIVAATLDGAPALAVIRGDNPGLAIRTRELADGSTLATLDFNRARLANDAIIAHGEAAAAALACARTVGQLAASAYLLGLAEQALTITLEYLCTREQFGRPIGAFQALQHRAVDLFIQKSLAAAVVDEALATFDTTTDPTQRQCAASRAKYRATEAALLICRQAVQLHGGIGYTDECNVGLYLNRALVLGSRYGNAAFHARALETLLDDNEADGADSRIDPASIEVPDNGNWDKLSDEQFRAVIRRFFETEYPADLRYPSRRLRWEQIKPWYLRLSGRGWVAPAWPAEHGGMGLSPAKMLIYIEEQERWGVGRAPDMGIQMVGPLLIRHGTPEQRARYLPQILAGEYVWCQGYSEPNAGSDLASLKTEAVADGDEFVINGQKTWTTLAQDATHMFCLARTSKSGKQQEGISFFLIDFKQPGITVRPIRNIAGDEEFCEVFLDNVRVPADCLVGEINKGWTIAKALLGFERIFIGSPKQSQYALMRLEALARATGATNDAAFRDRLVRFKLDVRDLETTYQRFADIVRRGETLGPDVSLLKIWGTETFARLSELMVETAGIYGAAIGKQDYNGTEVDVMSQFYNARPATIYGGSNEIQRNIIAKGVLRLPG